MEFLPSKKLCHANRLYRLILKFSESFEVTAIAAIQTENEVKNILHNTVRELPITLERRLHIKNGGSNYKQSQK